jgi:hypothetical protein
MYSGRHRYGSDTWGSRRYSYGQRQGSSMRNRYHH